MGKYDNYNNYAGIIRAQKKIIYLLGRKKPDLFAIDLAQKELDTEKLFESCQIFGRAGLRGNPHDPNLTILFSDDNGVMLFDGKLISYKKLKSYKFSPTSREVSNTITRSRGGLARAIVGHALAGDVGAIVGAATADTYSETVTQEVDDGFLLRIFLKDRTEYQHHVRRPTQKWDELVQKLQMIIDSNSAD